MEPLLVSPCRPVCSCTSRTSRQWWICPPVCRISDMEEDEIELLIEQDEHDDALIDDILEELAGGRGPLPFSE